MVLLVVLWGLITFNEELKSCIFNGVRDAFGSSKEVPAGLASPRFIDSIFLYFLEACLILLSSLLLKPMTGHVVLRFILFPSMDISVSFSFLYFYAISLSKLCWTESVSSSSVQSFWIPYDLELQSLPAAAGSLEVAVFSFTLTSGFSLEVIKSSSFFNERRFFLLYSLVSTFLGLSGLVGYSSFYCKVDYLLVDGKGKSLRKFWFSCILLDLSRLIFRHSALSRFMALRVAGKLVS